VEHLRDEALRVFEHVDVWVNNAGRGISRSVLDLTDEDFDTIMTVNVKSALYGMQAIVPYFKARGTGHLINVSSFLGRVPFSSQRSVYSAAKSALNSLTATLRLDLRAQYPGLHVSVVMPPMVKTQFAANALHGAPPPPGYRPAVGGPGQVPEQTAAAIVALIDQPQAEIYTDPAQAETAARYYADVAAFEAGMGR
jgi:short-subunit dehydrogenase